MEQPQTADVPESFFQYRAGLTNPLFEAWTVPNRVILSVAPVLSNWGVGLADVTWNQQATNLQDLQVTFSVPKLRSALRIGLDSITFDVVNPDWSDAPRLIELFDVVTGALKQNTEFALAKQEVALAMHVRSGKRDLKTVMLGLVNTEKLGQAEMYGISMYRDQSTWVIDKSLRYEGAYFIRLNRSFEASAAFSEVALAIYNDEVAALGLLGLTELLPS